MRERLKQMDEKLFMRFRSEPHGEIHHAALIQHQEVSTVRTFQVVHGGERTSAKSFFCLKHSEIPAERKQQ